MSGQRTDLVGKESSGPELRGQNKPVCVGKGLVIWGGRISWLGNELPRSWLHWDRCHLISSQQGRCPWERMDLPTLNWQSNQTDRQTDRPQESLKAATCSCSEGPPPSLFILPGTPLGSVQIPTHPSPLCYRTAKNMPTLHSVAVCRKRSMARCQPVWMSVQSAQK